MYVYSFLVMFNSYNQLFVKNKDIFRKELIVLFNNKKNLRCNIILEKNTVNSFTMGFILNYINTFKKELRKKKNSKTLLVKFVIKVLDNIYSNFNLIIKILGMSKNFYKWLNFFKLSSKLSINERKKHLYYIFQPSLNLGAKNEKKIKSIKKRLKKKYIYSNPM